MIYDRFENFEMYSALAPEYWKHIAEFVRNVTPETASGERELIPGELSVNVIDYTSKPLSECKVELHDYHVDVQVLLAGEETMCCLATDDLEVMTPMNPARDSGFFVFRSGTEVRLPMTAGMFAIFFPGEGHLTNWNEAAVPVRRAVFKIEKARLNH